METSIPALVMAPSSVLEVQFPRLIARLDVKGPNVIKGVQFEGLRIMGDPALLAERYYQDGAQELLFIDTVASLYGRNNLTSLVQETVRNVFIPLTVGGGIQSVEHARGLLSAGADKVAVNSSAIGRPELLRELAEEFGSQCVVVSIQAKKMDGRWEALTEGGREHSGRDVFEWLEEATQSGAGEVLITSVDRDGTSAGFDLELIQKISGLSTIPVVASGGYGIFRHLQDLLEIARPEGIAIGRAVHTSQETFGALRRQLGRALGHS